MALDEALDRTDTLNWFASSRAWRRTGPRFPLAWLGEAVSGSARTYMEGDDEERRESGCDRGTESVYQAEEMTLYDRTWRRNGEEGSIPLPTRRS